MIPSSVVITGERGSSRRGDAESHHQARAASRENTNHRFHFFPKSPPLACVQYSPPPPPPSGGPQRGRLKKRVKRCRVSRNSVLLLLSLLLFFSPPSSPSAAILDKFAEHQINLKREIGVVGGGGYFLFGDMWCERCFLTESSS